MRIRDRRGAAVRLLDRLEADPDGWLARALAPLSGAYVGLGALRRRALPARALPASPPSIGIGNLRVGGTGKTPVVADLALRLRAEGLKVGVLTRGYRGADGADEPGWLRAQGLEVVVDADRRRGHAEAARRGCEVVVLDDALQCRDRPGLTLAIVLDPDLERMPRPLPAGPAREGAVGLQRAPVWIVRRQASIPAVSSQPLSRVTVGIRLAPSALTGPADEPWGLDRAAELGPVLAVSGLARPSSFEADLRALGCEVLGAWRGPDHWSATSRDRDDLETFARLCGARVAICPEKNLVRLRALGLQLPVWCLRSRLQWDVADPLDATGIRAYLRLGTREPGPRTDG